RSGIPVAAVARPLPRGASRARSCPSCCSSASLTALPLDALDVRAERAQALVDALVAAVDLADVPDRRGSLGAEAGDQHRHARADVGARQPLTVEPGRAADHGPVRVAEDDPRTH